MIACVESLINTSIGGVCQKVKSPASPNPQLSFRLPKVIAIQKGNSYRKVFGYLYSISDGESSFELDANQASQATGLSRKTVYKVISFLKRVNLLRPLNIRTGRGLHSSYQLNWRKPKKCHPPIPLVSKYKTHPPGDQPMGKIISPHNRRLWNQAMKSFRELLQNSRLSKQQQRCAAQVLGRHLKGRTRAYGLKLYERLRSLVARIKAPGWIRSLQELYRWFMGLLKGLFKCKSGGKLKAKSKGKKRCKDYNDYLWQLHRQEVERVMAKRAQVEPTAEELWAQWRQEQEAERAWRVKRAELVRQELRRRRAELCLEFRPG